MTKCFQTKNVIQQWFIRREVQKRLYEWEIAQDAQFPRSINISTHRCGSFSLAKHSKHVLTKRDSRRRLWTASTATAVAASSVLVSMEHLVCPHLGVAVTWTTATTDNLLQCTFSFYDCWEKEMRKGNDASVTTAVPSREACRLGTDRLVVTIEPGYSCRMVERPWLTGRLYTLL